MRLAPCIVLLAFCTSTSALGDGVFGKGSIPSTTLDSSFDAPVGISFESQQISGKSIVGISDGVIGKRPGQGFCMVLRYADGTPYLYAGDGFALVHDPKTPGQIKRFDWVYPRLVLKYAKDGLQLRVFLTRDSKASVVEIDCSQLRRDADEPVPTFHFDRLRNTVSLKGDNTAFAFALIPQSRWTKELAIMRLELSSESGRLLRVNLRDPGVPDALPRITKDQLLASDLSGDLVNSQIGDDVPVLRSGEAPEGDRELLSRFSKLLSNSGEGN